MSGIEVSLRIVRDGVGRLTWSSTDDLPGLTDAVGLAAGDALVGAGLHRVEVVVDVTDRVSRRALHRCAFRMEGIRRQAHRTDDGWRDQAVYARLAGDGIDGPGAFTAVLNTVLPTKRLIAHVLIRNEAGRLLFLTTSYKPDWELPGGVVEPHESPRLAARRECIEEIGLDLDVRRVLVADWMPDYLGWYDALELIFDGGVLDEARIGQIRLGEGEILAAHWVDADEAVAHLTPHAARRLRTILALDGFGYLEAGEAIDR